MNNYSNEKEHDCTSLFIKLGSRRRTTPTITVRVNAHSYLPDGELETGWLPTVVSAFDRLSAQLKLSGVRISRMATVGIGPGVDAVAAAEIFSPKEIVITDLHSDVVQLAKTNILRNCTDLADCNIVAIAGDLCEPLESIANGGFDMIYENLPNLPVDNSIEALTESCLSASFFDPAKCVLVPNVIKRNALALHYLFLKQARAVLSPSGCVVCCIGVRVPFAVITSMFHELGYTVEVLRVAIIRQLQESKCIPEYAEMEEQLATEFRFFPYESAVALDKTMSQSESPESVINSLWQADFAISAREAADCILVPGKRIGHIGTVIKAVQRK